MTNLKPNAETRPIENVEAQREKIARIIDPRAFLGPFEDSVTALDMDTRRMKARAKADAISSAAILGVPHNYGEHLPSESLAGSVADTTILATLPVQAELEAIIEEVATKLEREYPDNVNTNAFCAAIRSLAAQPRSNSVEDGK